MSKPIKLQLIVLQKHMVHEICIMFLRNFAVHVKDRSDLHINEKHCRLACWEVSQRLNLMPEACVQTFSHTATSPPYVHVYIMLPCQTRQVHAFLCIQACAHFLIWKVWPTLIVNNYKTYCKIYIFLNIYFTHGLHLKSWWRHLAAAVYGIPWTTPSPSFICE